MKINYHAKKFKSFSNSPNGQVSHETTFIYYQENNFLTGEYNGGLIMKGHILGVVKDDDSITFVYHHMDTYGQLKSGHCHSTPEITVDGKLRLHEKWEWTFGGEGSGESVVEEIM